MHSDDAPHYCWQTINRIQNNCLCLHNICVCTVNIYYVCVYVYIYIYIYIYIHTVYILKIFTCIYLYSYDPGAQKQS